MKLIKQPESYAPMQRAKECDMAQNRAYRRAAKHMTEGQRRKEMRLMYMEIGRFALKAKDSAIMTAMLKEYEPYVTAERKPLSVGIKAKHEKMTAWYDAVRDDYLTAHREDGMEK